LCWIDIFTISVPLRHLFSRAQNHAPHRLPEENVTAYYGKVIRITVATGLMSF
jgi:hypothetical protein